MAQSKKALNYEFSIKTKDQKKAIDSLNAISLHLEAAKHLPSGNSSYDFDGIKTTNESFFCRRRRKRVLFLSLDYSSNHYSLLILGGK